MTYINIYKHINTHDWSFISEVDIPIYLSFATIKHIKFQASAILPFKQQKKKSQIRQFISDNSGPIVLR